MRRGGLQLTRRLTSSRLDSYHEILTSDIGISWWHRPHAQETLKAARPDDAYYWATHQGAELDLLMLKGSRRVGVEFKRADAPKLTPSMRIAMEDLKLDALFVLYPGLKRYALADRIEVLPATAIGEFTG